MIDVRTGAAALLIALMPMLATAAHAAEMRLGNLVIETPWTRATPAGAKVGAGYLAIVNTGDKVRRLTAATAPIAERVEIHSMTMTGGVMKMRRIDGGLELKPQTVTELKPGGYHLMFIGLKNTIKEGADLPVQLTFDGGDQIELVFVAAGIGARRPPGSTEIRPSGSNSGAAHGSNSGAQSQGGTAGTGQENKGSH